MARRATAEKNKRYLRKLMVNFPKVTPTLLAYASMIIYEKMMELTVVDTGQALLQWHVLPTKGTRSRYPKQQILWGYEGQNPTAPAGWKAWHAPSGAVSPSKEALIEHKISFSASMFHYIRSQPSLVNVHIYNPITPGFAGFAPGDDSQYAANALEAARVAMPEVAESARAQTIAYLRKEFPDIFK